MMGNTKTQATSGGKSPALDFLYNSIPGRILLKLVVRKSVSGFIGFFMDRRASKLFILRFIKKNDIDMEEYENASYKSFNDFFTREIKKESRPFSDNEYDLTAPCDGKLITYQITTDGAFHIKNTVYDIEQLLGDKGLADEFMDGTCLVFRLTTDDYHRYAYIDDGEVVSSKRIKGVLHTVRPIAFERYKVYTQNSREYTVLETKNFGKAVQMEVGALFVGRIKNHGDIRTFKRGEEKGMFEFGGSTIVMMFQKNTVSLDEAIHTNAQSNIETVVRMGQKIGEKTYRS